MRKCQEEAGSMLIYSRFLLTAAVYLDLTKTKTMETQNLYTRKVCALPWHPPQDNLGKKNECECDGIGAMSEAKRCQPEHHIYFLFQIRISPPPLIQIVQSHTSQDQPDQIS